MIFMVISIQNKKGCGASNRKGKTMKKRLLKIISAVLSLAIVTGICTVGSFAAGKVTDCDENCEFYPTIMIPGLGQSSVCVADENGDFLLDDDGNKIPAFPAYLNLGAIIKRAIIPVLATLFFQKDIGLTDAVADIINMCFAVNASDLNGKNTGNFIIEDFPYSYEVCNDYEKNDVNAHVPLHLYPTDLPYDHLYYFAYNSFGNLLDMADDLYEYIELVKEQTGHDKVNLVPISQGGTLASALFEYHPDVMEQIHKIIFIVPALDGSTIVGDILKGDINFLDKDYLYNGFLEEMGLLDEYTARLIEVLVRILPDEVVMSVFNTAVDELVSSIFSRSTSMWALCPSGDYEEASQRLLSAPEMANIKAQTDKYYQAQLHHRDNIQKMVNMGVQVFTVAEYNMNLINVGAAWNSQNADYIIQLDSTSMGAHAAKVGETLPADYVQQNTNCTVPGHNHISPDRVVDASTGLLPDTTFYFENQRHDLTQHNDVILKLAMQLIANDNIKDVYSSPEFPQFLSGRDIRVLTVPMETAKEALASGKLSATDAQKLDAAVKVGEAMLKDNLKTYDDFAKAAADIEAILVSAGVIEAKEIKDPSTLGKISVWLFNNFGTNGYSEFPKILLDMIF